MSVVESTTWDKLKFKYTSVDNYHGTCYYNALRLLLKGDFDKVLGGDLVPELVKKDVTRINNVTPFAKWANESGQYRFASPDESLHDEEGVLWVGNNSDTASHIVYFKDGYYYDDYMSITYLKDIEPLLIIVKKKDK